MSTRNYGSSPVESAQQVAVMNLQGENGTTFINDTTAWTGRWTAIKCISAAVFTKLTCPRNNGRSMDTISLAAGDTLMVGLATAITLASGSVLAYRE